MSSEFDYNFDWEIIARIDEINSIPSQKELLVVILSDFQIDGTDITKIISILEWFSSKQKESLLEALYKDKEELLLSEENILQKHLRKAKQDDIFSCDRGAVMFTLPNSLPVKLIIRDGGPFVNSTPLHINSTRVCDKIIMDIDFRDNDILILKFLNSLRNYLKCSEREAIYFLLSILDIDMPICIGMVKDGFVWLLPPWYDSHVGTNKDMPNKSLIFL